MRLGRARHAENLACYELAVPDEYCDDKYCTPKKFNASQALSLVKRIVALEQHNYSYSQYSNYIFYLFEC